MNLEFAIAALNKGVLGVGTTPNRITDLVRKFCNRLKCEAPAYLTVNPFGDAIPKRCFLNCHKMVECYGGKMIQGVMIWEQRGIGLESEHHAIWQKDNGERVDVTPTVDGEERILFAAFIKQPGLNISLMPNQCVLFR